jgi:hypothetical protein
MSSVWSDTNDICLLWSFDNSCATRSSVTVYVRTPSCGSTTNPPARASDRICQICFASAFASALVKLAILEPENGSRWMVSFAPGLFILKDSIKTLKQASVSTSIRPSVFDMALLTAPRQKMCRYCCPSSGMIIETNENTAGGELNHLVSTWTKKTADGNYSGSRLLLLADEIALMSSTARDAIQ